MHTVKVFKNGNSQAVQLPKEFLAPFEIIPFTELDCEYFGGL